MVCVACCNLVRQANLYVYRFCCPLKIVIIITVIIIIVMRAHMVNNILCLRKSWRYMRKSAMIVKKHNKFSSLAAEGENVHFFPARKFDS